MIGWRHLLAMWVMILGGMLIVGGFCRLRMMAFPFDPAISLGLVGALYIQLVLPVGRRRR